MKINGGLATLVVIAALLAGLIAGFAIHPDAIEVVKKETIEKTVPVEKIVEVVKEVPIDLVSLRDQAVEDFMSEVEDNDNLKICNGNEYGFDEITISRVSDDFGIQIDEDEKEVIFSIKLKYKESDLRSCRATYDVSVFYEPEEDPVIKIL